MCLWEGSKSERRWLSTHSETQTMTTTIRRRGMEKKVTPEKILPKTRSSSHAVDRWGCWNGMVRRWQWAGCPLEGNDVSKYILQIKIQHIVSSRLTRVMIYGTFCFPLFIFSHLFLHSPSRSLFFSHSAPCLLRTFFILLYLSLLRFDHFDNIKRDDESTVQHVVFVFVCVRRQMSFCNADTDTATHIANCDWFCGS